MKRGPERVIVLLAALLAPAAAKADALPSELVERLGFTPALESRVVVAGTPLVVARVARRHAARVGCSSITAAPRRACATSEDGPELEALIAFRTDTGDALGFITGSGYGQATPPVVEAIEVDGDDAREVVMLMSVGLDRVLVVIDVSTNGLCILEQRTYDSQDVHHPEDASVFRGIRPAFVDVDGDGRVELRLAREWSPARTRRVLVARFGEDADDDEVIVELPESLLFMRYAYYRFDVDLGAFVRFTPRADQ